MENMINDDKLMAAKTR